MSTAEGQGNESTSDSPIVEGPIETLEADEAASISCYWGGTKYGAGDVVCMGGKKHVCTKNGWVNNGFNC